MSAVGDPFLLEFIVNLRWALYVIRERNGLDVEAAYPELFTDASEMEIILSSSSFAHISSLGAVPFGALEIAKGGLHYLLLAEAILTDCPPSMHIFMRTAAARTERATHSPSGGVDDGEAHTPSLRAEHHLSGDNFSARSARREGEAERRSLSSSVELRTVDSVAAGAFTRAERMTDDQLQAMVMLTRWLIRSGVVPPEELALTLGMLDDERGVANDVDTSSTGGFGSSSYRQQPSLFPSEDGYSARSRSSASTVTSSRTRRDGSRRVSFRRAARRLTQLSPFYLGAHVLISRCLLMHYTCTLLTVDAIGAHVASLEEGQGGEVAPLPSPPATTLEGALLRWLRLTVAKVLENGTADVSLMHSSIVNASMRSGTQTADMSFFSTMSRSRPATARRADDLLRRPAWRAWLAQPRLKNDMYAVVQDGIALGIACHFYVPHLMPLETLTPPTFMEPPRSHAHPLQTLKGTEERDLAIMIRNWASVLRCAEALGLHPMLQADEVVRHGTGALQMHILRFTEELFAVLATRAEEDARASLDQQLEDAAAVDAHLPPAPATASFTDGSSAMGGDEEEGDSNTEFAPKQFPPATTGPVNAPAVVNTSVASSASTAGSLQRYSGMRPMVRRSSVNTTTIVAKKKTRSIRPTQQDPHTTSQEISNAERTVLSLADSEAVPIVEETVLPASPDKTNPIGGKPTVTGDGSACVNTPEASRLNSSSSSSNGGIPSSPPPVAAVQQHTPMAVDKKNILLQSRFAVPPECPEQYVPEEPAERPARVLETQEIYEDISPLSSRSLDDSQQQRLGAAAASGEYEPQLFTSSTATAAVISAEARLLRDGASHPDDAVVESGVRAKPSEASHDGLVDQLSGTSLSHRSAASTSSSATLPSPSSSQHDSKCSELVEEGEGSGVTAQPPRAPSMPSSVEAVSPNASIAPEQKPLDVAPAKSQVEQQAAKEASELITHPVPASSTSASASVTTSSSGTPLLIRRPSEPKGTLQAFLEEEAVGAVAQARYVELFPKEILSSSISIPVDVPTENTESVHDRVPIVEVQQLDDYHDNAVKDGDSPRTGRTSEDLGRNEKSGKPNSPVADTRSPLLTTPVSVSPLTTALSEMHPEAQNELAQETVQRSAPTTPEPKGALQHVSAPNEAGEAPRSSAGSLTIRKWIAESSSSPSAESTASSVTRPDREEEGAEGAGPQESTPESSSRSASSSSASRSSTSHSEASTNSSDEGPKRGREKTASPPQSLEDTKPSPVLQEKRPEQVATPPVGPPPDVTMPTPIPVDIPLSQQHGSSRGVPEAAEGSRRTPDSELTQSSIVPLSPGVASSFLPVEGSPIPSLMSVGSRWGDDADSHFSSVSQGFAGALRGGAAHGRTPIFDSENQRQLHAMLSQLVLDTPPSEINANDAELLLATVARQQELIAQLTQRLSAAQHTSARTPVTAAQSADKRRQVSFVEEEGGDGQSTPLPPVPWPRGFGRDDASRTSSLMFTSPCQERKPKYTDSVIDRMCAQFGESVDQTNRSVGSVSVMDSLNRTLGSQTSQGNYNDQRMTMGQLADTDISSNRSRIEGSTAATESDC